MRLLRHILLTAVAMSPIFLGSCNIYDRYPVENNPLEREKGVLVLHVGVASQTRADEILPNERMHSLRVVLLNEEGKVEYNEFYNEESDNKFGGDGLQEYKPEDGRLIFITDFGKKKIFFIANEESVTTVNGVTGQSLTNVLESYEEGAEGFAEAMNDLYFTPDFNKNLVLSSFYEFDFNPTDSNKTKKFWLVYAASKFDFTFVNNRASNISIEELSVNSVADDMYLMANLDGEEKTKTLSDGREGYWIDWLAEVCEATNEHPELPDNEKENDRYKWIHKYYLPANDQVDSHEKIDIKEKIEPSDAGNWVIEANAQLNLPVVYCSESKYAYDESKNRQNYTIDIKLSDGTNEKEWKTQPLDNLHTLFRHTHAKVTVTINGTPDDIELELEIGICPWVEETIEIPTFD